VKNESIGVRYSIWRGIFIEANRGSNGEFLGHAIYQGNHVKL
jgi:hypothetical protein